jgi:rare lipoprotein A
LIKHGFFSGLVGAIMGLVSCTGNNQPVVQTPAKFTVGYPYQTGGEWRYPQVFNNYDATGLATVSDSQDGQLTLDGETYDSNALGAASPVLQLPCIVTITDLVNGNTMDVRVNDRGPNNPGRVIAVTPKVASLLGFPPGGIVEVEVVLNAQETAALDASLGQGPKLTAAPEAGIEVQSLAPPGSSQAAGVAQNLTPADNSAPDPAGVTLSGTVTTVPPSPGPLFVQIPGFGRERDAAQTAEQLYGIPYQIVPVFGGDRTLYAINAGPYHSVQDADAALQTILQRGITDPQIIVR